MVREYRTCPLFGIGHQPVYQRQCDALVAQGLRSTGVIGNDGFRAELGEGQVANVRIIRHPGNISAHVRERPLQWTTNCFHY